MPLMRLDQVQQFAAINPLVDPGAIAGPIVVPSCAQIVLLWIQDSGKVAHNVLYGRYSGGFVGSVTQANSILTALTTTGAWTALATHLSTTGALAAISIRDVNTPNNAIIGSNVLGAFGTSANAPYPNEVALVITLRTALTGQANRGRMFIPNWAQGTVDPGNVVAPQVVADLQAWANTINGALTAGGYQHALGHPARQAYVGRTGRQHPARPAGSELVTQCIVRDNHWDTMRRRGLK